MGVLEPLVAWTSIVSLHCYCFITTEGGNLLPGLHAKLQRYVIHLTNTAGASRAESIVPTTNQRESDSGVTISVREAALLTSN
jgi:hypothetical protein